MFRAEKASLFLYIYLKKLLKLTLPVLEEDFKLIGIHTNLEAYKLAFMVNKYFSVSFKRSTQDVDKIYNDTFAHFPLFHNYDKNWDCEMYLVANKFTSKVPHLKSSGSLFNNAEVATQTFYLFDQLKHIDYFIKIEDDLNIFDSEHILQTINTIKQIKKAYLIDNHSIKNPEYLIFK